MVALVGAIVGGVLQPTAAEGAIVLAWTGPNDGDGDFNDLVISFSPIATNALNMIEGDAYSHNQGSLGLQYGIEVRLDNLWVEIDSWSHGDANHHLLTERTQGGPLQFAMGMVDGIRLKSLYEVNFGYHDLQGTKFIFDDPIDPGEPVVPEPASLLIWGSGAMGLAFIQRRRQRNKQITSV